MSAEPRPIRARSAAEKSRRRDDILRAAERLWEVTPYVDLSMNQVAREARLAKGTLYLYFDTKEQLFLALLAEHLTAWFLDLSGRLETLAQEQTAPLTASALAALLTEVTVAHEPLRRLLLLLTTVLERNLPPEAEQQFRAESRRHLRFCLSKLPYSPALNFQIISHTYALAVGWQQLTESMAIAREHAMPLREGYDFVPFETGFGLALQAVLARLLSGNGGEARP